MKIIGVLKQLRFSLFSLNILWVIFSLCCYLSGWVNPVLFWPVHFLSYCSYLLLVGHIGFLLWWISSKRYQRLLISLVCLLIGAPYFSPMFQWRFSDDPQNRNPGSVRMLTYNLQLFRHSSSKNPQPTIDSIRNFIFKYQPDVICFQEYSTYLRKRWQQKLTQNLADSGYRYYHVSIIRKTDNEAQGMAIFSKFPIIGKGSISLRKISKLNGCIYADIVLPQDTFRVYNLHLQSNLIKTEEYSYMNEVKEDSYLQRMIVIRVLRKIKEAVIKRSQQAAGISSAIRQSPFPAIVMGDFNDPPSSYVYRILRNQLNDPFVTTGSGRGGTYNGPLPTFRIDYLLHDTKLNAEAYYQLKPDFSDHFPVMIDFK